jgi:hypothetical protein
MAQLQAEVDRDAADGIPVPPGLAEQQAKINAFCSGGGAPAPQTPPQQVAGGDPNEAHFPDTQLGPPGPALRRVSEMVSAMVKDRRAGASED